MPTFDINLTGVQENLVSGTNIKTINGESVLGSGDLDVSQDISGIATNASAITTIQGEQTTQDAAIALNTAKNSYPSVDATKLAGIEAGAEVNDNAAEIKTKYESNANTNAFTDAEKSTLANQSGTNTGDQDISGIATNASAITTIQGEQTTQDAAIALNTAKNSYPSADATKLAGIESGAEVNTVDSVNGEVGVVVLDTDDINEGTINEYYTDARVSANADVVANTAKNSYPTADATKLAGIETGAEVNDTAAEIKTKYESNADTNAFTDAEKTNLGNQSGTNTGDQDLSGLQETLVSGTNIKTINGDSVLGVGNITIASLSVGTDGQIPYTNAAGDDLAYSNWLLRTDNTLTINQTADRKGIRINGFDDQSGKYSDIYISNFGETTWITNNTIRIASGAALIVTSGSYTRFTTSGFQVSSSYSSFGATSSLGARLGVKGSGTTSATTSFLVQNSAGTDLLKVTDDGKVGIGLSSPTYTIHNQSLNPTMGTISNGNGFPRWYFGRINGTSKTNRQFEFTMGSDGSLGWYDNGANGSRIRTVMLMNLNGSIVVGGGSSNTSRFQIVQDTVTSRDYFHISPSTSPSLQGTIFTINSSGNAGLGMSSSGSVAARLHVKGSGTTSATTSLLLQNSAGTDLLKVRDNGILNTPNLPTSSAGLSAGDLWNNSGVINIV